MRRMGDGGTGNGWALNGDKNATKYKNEEILRSALLFLPDRSHSHTRRLYHFALKLTQCFPLFFILYNGVYSICAKTMTMMGVFLVYLTMNALSHCGHIVQVLYCICETWRTGREDGWGKVQTKKYVILLTALLVEPFKAAMNHKQAL